MPQIVNAMVQFLLCPSLFPVNCHVFEMVQNRRIVFCDNAVVLLCKKMENAMKLPCFSQESTLPASYLQWGVGEASTDMSCFLKDMADIISAGSTRRGTSAMRH